MSPTKSFKKLGQSNQSMSLLSFDSDISCNLSEYEKLKKKDLLKIDKIETHNDIGELIHNISNDE